MSKFSFFAIIISFLILSGCGLVSNTFSAKDTTKEFVETIFKNDYEKALHYMALDHEMAKNIDPEELKAGFAILKEKIVKNFGTELDYSLMNSVKRFSTKEGENTPDNTTLVNIQFSNNTDFGVFEVLLDDKSQKILNFKMLDLKQPVPSMTGFWLFGLLAICVLIFNIYVIRLIKRSDLKKKWLKYLAVICLNVPAIAYSPIDGLNFSLLKFQLLFGISFSYMGYLNSMWTLGVPLGGLYWLWKLKYNYAPEPTFDTYAEAEADEK